MSSPGTTPANKFFHRAFLVLMPASAFSLVAYDHDFAWYWTIPAIALWAVGIYFLKRGAERMRAR